MVEADERDEVPGMMTREESGRRIEAAVRAAGYTPTGASRRLGWDKGRLWQYTRGGKVPGWTTVARMVAVLGLDLGILFAPVDADRDGSA